MHALNHRIKVFVFTERGGEIQYLMLRHQPRFETTWGPVVGPILPSENLETAACRRVRDEVGFERPLNLVDLHTPERWCLPDEQVIEWIYGYAVDPGVEIRKVARDVSDLRWDDFDRAFRSMELTGNRDAILRLHLTLTK
ncbi:MAG: NUDIX domain-containing protein [Planctomycetes bacterium]|nr:NUDIX domain-containing protein [Planctomycetota bacterium]